MTTNQSKRTKPVGELFELQDSAGGLSFYGELLSEAKTNTLRKKLRWTEMALYRITDGPRTGEYVLEIVGCSDVYHERGSDCESGVKTQSSKLPEESKPCPDCNPATDEDGNPLETIVSMESDRPRLYECPDAATVVTRLRDASANGVISGPGQRILNEAANEDEGIRSEIRTVRHI